MNRESILLDNRIYNVHEAKTSNTRVGLSILDKHLEITEIVQVINTPTNFSPIQTIVCSNKIAYGYTMEGYCFRIIESSSKSAY